MMEMYDLLVVSTCMKEQLKYALIICGDLLMIQDGHSKMLK